MSEYKKYFYRLHNLRENSEVESSYDPKELEMGIKQEKEHTDDEAVARKIAIDHLKEDPKYYTKMKKCDIKEGMLPPVIKTLQPIAMSIKGSPTGVLPTGIPQADILKHAPEEVNPESPKGNTVAVNNTPQNSVINSTLAPLRTDLPPNSSMADLHPFQIQKNDPSYLSKMDVMTTEGKKITKECDPCGCEKPNTTHNFTEKQIKKLKKLKESLIMKSSSLTIKERKTLKKLHDIL